MSMKKFNVYRKENKRQAVPTSRFNGWALFLPIFWAIYHRVWSFFWIIVLMAVARHCILGPMDSAGYPPASHFALFCAFFGAQVYLSSWANKLREFSLIGRGFELIQEYEAKNGDVAIERSLHLQPDSSAKADIESAEAAQQADLAGTPSRESRMNPSDDKPAIGNKAEAG